MNSEEQQASSQIQDVGSEAPHDMPKLSEIYFKLPFLTYSDGL